MSSRSGTVSTLSISLRKLYQYKYIENINVLILKYL